MLPSTLFSVPVWQCHVEWRIPPWLLWTGMNLSSLSLDIMFMLWGLGFSCFRAVASLMQPKCVSSAWTSKAPIAHWLALTFTRVESNFGESNTAKQRLVQELSDILIHVCEEIQQDTIRFLTRSPEAVGTGCSYTGAPVGSDCDFSFELCFFYVFVFFLVCARWIEQSKSAKIFTLNISFIKTRCVCYLFYSFFEQFLCIIFVLCYFRHKVLNIWIWNSRLLNFILMCLYRKIQWSHPWGGSISTQNRKPYWRLRIWATTRLHPSSPSRTYILLRLCVHRELISDSLDLASFS